MRQIEVNGRKKQADAHSTGTAQLHHHRNHTNAPVQPPSTIDMTFVDPKLYALKRRQRPDLPPVYKPSRSGEAKNCQCA